MTGSIGAQEVADALAMTLEREDASGAPWCPPRDGMAVRRWVTDRSAQLGTGLRRLVRLVRLMALADGRDHVRFLYMRLTALRAQQFRHALQVAARDGRLTPRVATLSDAGVHLCEAGMASADAAFEIDFGQMPRLAALLDFLHNALGFSTVADLVAPLAQASLAAGSADEVARRLQAALNAWLGERLESANHIRQAQHMRAFLARRGKVAPEAVDDEVILAFWSEAATVAEAERIDGFRLYRSAACALLRYRQALRDAAIAQHLERAISEGLDAGEENAIDKASTSDGESWRSPLMALVQGPARAIKWLTRKEQLLLLNYLGGPADDGDADAEADDSEGDWDGGLAGDARFDLALRRTLLRADVFGAAQASIVARLRKRAGAADAIAQATAPIDEAAYARCATAYAEVRAQLHLECLAALAALMEAGAPEGIILLDQFGGRAAVAAVLGALAQRTETTDTDETVVDIARTKIAAALRAAIADPSVLPGEVEALLREALAAARKVSRAGFRREDRGAGVLALGRGASAAVGVMHELDRLAGALSQPNATAGLADDRAHFLETFGRIYGTAASSA